MDNKENVMESREFAEDALSGVGTRIKALRKKLGMTQHELAGDNITRNMLSRIENGAALPSLGTLVYIAERLNVPCGCLLDDTSLADHTRAKAVKEARDLMKFGDYDKAYRLVCEDGIVQDDETTLIMIECNLNLARKLTSTHLFFDASQKLREAAKLCKKTSYSTAGSGYIADLYYSLARRTLPLKSKDEDTAPPPDFDRYIDIYIYIRLIDMFDKGDIHKAVNLSSMCEISDKTLSAHIAAKLDMANGRYNDAISKLREITVREKHSPSAHGSLLLYRIYGDLEECAKSEGDYVSAYGYREEKNKLFTAMSGIEL